MFPTVLLRGIKSFFFFPPTMCYDLLFRGYLTINALNRVKRGLSNFSQTGWSAHISVFTAERAPSSAQRAPRYLIMGNKSQSCSLRAVKVMIFNCNEQKLNQIYCGSQTGCCRFHSLGGQWLSKANPRVHPPINFSHGYKTSPASPNFFFYLPAARKTQFLIRGGSSNNNSKLSYMLFVVINNKKAITLFSCARQYPFCEEGDVVLGIALNHKTAFLSLHY